MTVIIHFTRRNHSCRFSFHFFPLQDLSICVNLEGFFL